MAPRGEGRLVPIPPRVRAIAPPALPVRIFGLALLLALALMVGAKPAAAKTPCWKQVVQDWFEDSTIDRTYPRSLLQRRAQERPQRRQGLQQLRRGHPERAPTRLSRPDPRQHRQRRLDTAREADAASWQCERSRPSRAGTGVLQASVRQAGPARSRLDAGPAHDHGRIGSPARRRRSRRADYAPLPGQASRSSGHVEPDSGTTPRIARICRDLFKPSDAISSLTNPLADGLLRRLGAPQTASTRR